jgi:Arc/MetJ-type ribon-helix-helix transcriptional regulator
MTQIPLQIPDDLTPFIERSVKSGPFSDAADFVLHLLYNVQSQSEAASIASQDAGKQKFSELRAAVNIGIEQLRKGETVEFNPLDVIQRGRARFAAKAEAHG